MVKRIFLPVCLVFQFMLPANASTEAEYSTALQYWALVLRDFVDEKGRIDFHRLAGDSGKLDAFVRFLSKTSPQSSPSLFPAKEDRLAYHLNAYNALAMHGVLEKGIPEGFNGFFRRAAFFKFRKIILGGVRTSLYDYENQVIRPLGEPRIHFALNCMVKDCPRLPREPFMAGRLEKQLDTAASEFFRKNRHVRVAHEQQVLYLSSILDFYTEDFVDSGRAVDLPAYVNNYLDPPVPENYRVKFLKYDWTINSQPD